MTPQTLFGMSDAAVHVKYNFYKERDGSKLPAMAISGVIQIPTGDVNKELGTGLFNYYVNGILEKSVTSKTTFRLNGGILFAGSDQSGELGIRTRGRVFTASGSLVKQFTRKLDFGAELSGPVTSNFNLSEGRLQPVVGGNYLVRKNITFDFGVAGGKFAASPRLGLILGVSIDLQRPSEQH
ncbi:MAG: transporter [Acidobacteriota bacterium]